MKYNGWTNYETWLVNLWITNEAPLDSDMTAAALEEYVRELAEIEAPNATGMISDLLNGAISAVDWHEIIKFNAE